MVHDSSTTCCRSLVEFKDTNIVDTPDDQSPVLQRSKGNSLAAWGVRAEGSVLCCLQNVVMLMSDFMDWLIPDIPKDISLQMHKEKILMVELFMKEEQGKRLSARDNHGHDYNPPSAGFSPSQPRSRQANCC